LFILTKAKQQGVGWFKGKHFGRKRGQGRAGKTPCFEESSTGALWRFWKAGRGAPCQKEQRLAGYWIVEVEIVFAEKEKIRKRDVDGSVY